jgi:hypothetical protein
MKWYLTINRSCQLVAACRLSLVIALVFCTLASCSQRDDKHGTVSGSVNLDGQPLPTGAIRFTPVDGHVSPTEGVISEGKFSVQTGIGDSRVTISAPKVTGKRKMYNTPDSPTVDIVVELLPAQYNTQSTLTLKVAAGSQQQNYDLKSGK